MRRWLIILLLLVYPFQVVLAVADQCCVMTSRGVTHHAAEPAGAGASAGQPVLQSVLQPVFLADDAASAATDPHCPACGFGQVSSMPSHTVDLPAVARHLAAIALPLPFLASVPRARPERPDWRLPAAS